MERKSDGICRKLITTSETGCQIFAYVIPDLRAFAFIARWRSRSKTEVSQPANKGFV
jgi:hypothetical protein